MVEAMGAQRFVSLLMGAVANCSLYAPNHPAVLEFSQRAARALAQDDPEAGGAEILLVGNDLVVNRIPLRDAGVHGRGLVKRLRQRGLDRVDFLAGVTGRDIGQFAAALAAGDGPLPAIPRIKTGTIDLRSASSAPAESVGVPEELATQEGRLGRLQEIILPEPCLRSLDMLGLEEIVAGFIVTMRREANILRLICPVRTYSEYIYTHASNVMALSLLQAESLGIQRALLHELGVAALLHDIGKLHVSKTTLNKTGRLNDREWSEILRHPLYGACYLSKIEGLTRLAPIVAVEHHMRFDGQGYPQLKSYRRGQHICSQIVAIADFFDALRSRRPYKRDWEIPEIIALLRRGAGNEFNPELVDNFARILVLALKEQ